MALASSNPEVETTENNSQSVPDQKTSQQSNANAQLFTNDNTAYYCIRFHLHQRVVCSCSNKPSIQMCRCRRLFFFWPYFGSFELRLVLVRRMVRRTRKSPQVDPTPLRSLLQALLSQNL